MSPYPAKLMNAGKTAKHREVANHHVARELGAIRQYRIVSDHAVMRHVHICHNPVSVAQSRITEILRGTNVECAELTYDIVVADFQPGGFVIVFFVLRYFTKGHMVKYAISATDLSSPGYHDVRA
jgi:hypothetical protein